MYLIFRRIVLVCVLLYSVLSHTASQYTYAHRFSYPEFEENRSYQLLFHLNNSNYVKNNEFKGNFHRGHTLIGYHLQPSLMYYAGDRLRIQAGAFFQQYSGHEYHNLIRPVLSVHLRMSPSTDLIMGSLRGHVHHRMIEPLLDAERQYLRPVENGLQLLVNKPWLWMDTWVDWEQFIQPGDLFPEVFTAGLSAVPELLDNSVQPWRISLPVNVIATHVGGEVSDYPEKVQTSVNLAGGLKAAHTFDGKLQKAGVFGYVMNYQNINNHGPLGVNSGHAWYTGAFATMEKVNLMIGYYSGRDFVALRGNGLFQSVSHFNDQVYDPHRLLVNGKVGYHRTFLKNIKFSFLVESYYDIHNEQLNFASEIQISFNPSFFITEAEFF